MADTLLLILPWPQQQRPANNSGVSPTGAGKPGWPATDADSASAPSPSRQQLLVSQQPVFSNPVHPSNMSSFSAGSDGSSPAGGPARYEAAPIPTDATGVPVSNPFNR